MRKAAFGMAVLALALPALSAAAAPQRPSVEALRSAIFAPDGDSVSPGAAPDGADWKSSCTVTTDCGPYNHAVSCTSASGDCKSGTNASGVPFVKCDGVRTTCGLCHVSLGCYYGGQVIQCTGSTWNDCEITDPTCSIQCGSTAVGCQMCP